MKNMLLLQAKYNQFADNNLLETLQQVEFSRLQHRVDSYYKGVVGSIEHAILGNIMFFGKIFISYTDKAVDVRDLLDLSLPQSGLKEKYKNNFLGLKKAVQTTDSKIIEIIENIHDFEQIGKIEFPNIAFVKPRGELILAALNHNIHHRGEVSAILDILGISNNFAGMLSMK